MPQPAEPTKPRNTIVVILAFPTESSEYPGGHLPENECWGTCFVSLRKKDMPGRRFRLLKKPVVARELMDIPRAVKKALTEAGFKIRPNE